MSRAVEFLRDLLGGGPVASEEVKKQAQTAGIAQRSLFRAKARLGVLAEKVGFDEGWQWSLPPRTPGGFLGPMPSVAGSGASDVLAVAQGAQAAWARAQREEAQLAAFKAELLRLEARLGRLEEATERGEVILVPGGVAGLRPAIEQVLAKMGDELLILFDDMASPGA